MTARLLAVFAALATLAALLTVAPTAASAAPSADLYFSEYVEGSSNNKALEIANTTGAEVDLSTYTVELYSNGNTNRQAEAVLSGSLADGAVFVIANSSSVQEVLDVADITSGVANFNGDDVVVLLNNGTIIDVFGQYEEDPGSEWPGGGQNDTLRRKPTICDGDTNRDDPFDASVEWDVFPQDTFDGLGSHTADCNGDSTPPGQALPFTDGFDSDDCTVAGWQVVSVDTDQANTWSCSATFSNADVNGFGDTAPADEWLITPALDMDAQTDEVLDFSTYTRFTDSGQPYPQLEVVYSTDYDGIDPTTATWTQVDGATFSPEDSSTWTDSATVDLSGVSGTNVHFAFHYQSSGTSGGTAANWRLDSVNFDVAGIDPPPVSTVFIHEIQGVDAASPLEGQTVSAQAVVTSLFEANDTLDGFFIQEEDAQADADPATSEGIFVFCRTAGCPEVSVGDLVTVVGEVEEFFDMTQIDVGSTGSIVVDSNGNPLPTATAVDMPAVGPTDAPATFESVEGMLISVNQKLVVSEYFQLARYGELVLTVNERSAQFTDANEPGVAEYAAFLDDLATKRIIVDDNNNTQNDATSGPLDNEQYPFPQGGLSVTNSFRGGDSITGLTGVMHWSFAGQSGTDAWRIRPVPEAASFAFTSENPRPVSPPDVGGELTVASFNVLNYFTTIDSRGADSAVELDRQRAKIASAICAIDADIVGLIEIENNGSTALVDLLEGADGVNANCGPYSFIDTGMIGTDAIAVAFIYKAATVAPRGDFAVLDSSVDPRFIDTKNRPALAQTFESTADGEAVTVIVNHLKSKGSPCDDVGDPGLNDGAANCNLTRASAAAAMVDWLAADPTASGDPDFLIIGDLNAYRQEDPIDNIELGSDDTAGTDDDYTDLLDSFVGEDAYSYVFDGQIGYLDYAMANQSLLEQVTGAAAWLINADEPSLLDYNDAIRDEGEASFERKSNALELFAPDAFRSSDHDPVIVGLNLSSVPPVPTCNGLEATIIGTDGRDRLVGTNGPDVIVGLGGNDVINGLNGDDVICGGDGNDVINGSRGNDMLFGERGNDRMVGHFGEDMMWGGDGVDNMSGGADDDMMDGGDGSDRMNGQAGNDDMDGGEGDDRMLGTSGNDIIVGGPGNDRIVGGSGLDDLMGGDDDDIILGGSSADSLDGGDGIDNLNGNGGIDVCTTGEVYRSCELQPVPEG